MSALAAVRARRTLLRLVIFDCDGVLIDSEGIANRVIAEELTALGWPMDAAGSHARFFGMAMADMVPLIERAIGQHLSQAWLDRIAARLIAALATESRAMPGAPELLAATSALGLEWRIASNSSHAEMAAKFARAGMTALVAGRLHSALDIIAAGGRGKPSPELFLAAAAASGVEPGECLVVEDSPTGATAAGAAGMTCLGYVPAGDGSALRACGAHVFADLRELPALFQAARSILR